MTEVVSDKLQQHAVLKKLSGGVTEAMSEARAFRFAEVRVVSEPGARAFEAEVNRLLQEGWVIIDAKVVSQSMHDPDTNRICHSSRLRAILARPKV
ncbi:MAG: hypothetical protein QHH02_04685 [Syntrophomonadaceae bacterium]|mgnify:CR=1 FL=1|nr:hypothetical protein [Syntrophomonadaceae bacterium]